MRFFQTIISSAAFAALVAALEINQFPAQGVVAGQTYTITYSPADDKPTTFILRQGKSTDLDTIETITTTATGGKFDWTPSKSLPNKPDYALEIKQGDVINYSAQFPLTGGSDSAPQSSAAPSSSKPSSTPVSSAAPSSMKSSASPVSSPASSPVSSPASSPSATISTSMGSNSTVSSATLSVSRTSGATATPTGTRPNVPEVSGNAGNSLLANPIAAIIGAAAAFAYLA